MVSVDVRKFHKSTALSFKCLFYKVTKHGKNKIGFSRLSEKLFIYCQSSEFHQDAKLNILFVR